jgi:hypothetical protein
MGTTSSTAPARRWLRRLAILFGVLLGMLVVAAIVVFVLSSQRLQRRFEVPDTALTIPTDPASVARATTSRTPAAAWTVTASRGAAASSSARCP